MADPRRRLAENASGEFFVDDTCIDCAACQQLAEGMFVEGDGFSYVARQPATDGERQRALMALVACPTASIGTTSHLDAKPGLAAFPELVEDDVYLCGLTSEKSYGGWSYFIRRSRGADGNVLVDSPRAAKPLVERLRALGGARLMLLTHADDVADHEALRRELGVERIMHEADIDAGTAGVERRLTGREPVALAPDLLAIPVPGHTEGHVVYLYREKFLFTGDHLAWDPEARRLEAFRDYCWYSWSELVRSTERLLDYRFEWVLPGHGWRWRAPSAAAMRAELERLVTDMRTTTR